MATTAPSLADARRAAEAVAVEGVSQVLLFGSLARGEESLESDIDLVAIFDDLDYRTRWDRKVLLERLAADAAGRPVDVRVTDWPEWTIRSEVVTTSFESAIAVHAVVLWRGEPQGVNWGKEIGLPTTNQGDAINSLEHVRQALTRLYDNLDLSRNEQGALEDRDPTEYLWAMAVRLRSVCSEAQLVAENSLKALVHHRGRDAPGLTHDLEGLLEKLSVEDQQNLRTMFTGIEPKDVSPWRKRGTYPADCPEVPLGVLVTTAHRTTTTATRLARFAADRLSPTHRRTLPAIRSPLDEVLPPPDAGFITDGIRRFAGRIDSVLTTWDLDAQSPTAVMAHPPPPEPCPSGDDL